MKKIIAVFLVASMVFLYCGNAIAEIIHLKDGTSTKGEITETSGDSITVKTKFGEMTIPKSDIDRVEYGETKPIQEKKDEPTEKKEGDYFQGNIDGQSLAKKIYHGGVGWGIGAYAGHFFLGILGSGLCFGLSFIGTDPPIKYTLEKKDFSAQYQIGFKEGYHGETRVNNAIGAGIGMGLGMITSAILYYSIVGR